jgi:hypothetical protein
MHMLHPNLARQKRIERPPQIIRLPALGAEETDRLAQRMDAGVGPSCTGRGGPASHQPFQHRLEFSLNRAIRRLTLPSCEAAPIVLKHR